MSQTDYFDSSALVKRYMAENGSGWVIGRYQDATRIIATVDFSRVEIAAAFAAKLRGHFITQADYERAREMLTADAHNRYHLLPVTSERVDCVLTFRCSAPRHYNEFENGADLSLSASDTCHSFLSSIRCSPLRRAFPSVPFANSL